MIRKASQAASLLGWTTTTREARRPERAVKRAHTAYAKAERAQREHQHAAPVEDPEAA